MGGSMADGTPTPNSIPTGLSVFVRAKNRCDRIDGVVRLAAL
jgi:hypothetical protein